LSSVVLTPRARHDLLEVWSYIASDSEKHADAFVDRLDDALQLLARQPGMGRRRDDLVPGIQSFPVASYIIFYRANPGGIEVVRVLHASRNIEALL
jgi:toxin ParE1/3/4